MWTVTQLQPSRDSIPFQTAGTLWEATATAAPVNGGVPVVPGFAARGGADSYPVLWPVPTAPACQVFCVSRLSDFRFVVLAVLVSCAYRYGSTRSG